MPLPVRSRHMFTRCLTASGSAASEEAKPTNDPLHPHVRQRLIDGYHVWVTFR